MGTILRDDFNGGSGSAWSSTNWPFAQYQSSTQQPTRTQVSGFGVVQNQAIDYKYGRFYFGAGSRSDMGINVRGKFDSSGSNAMSRFFLRGGRTGSADLDYTLPAQGYIFTLLRDSATLAVQKVVNSSVTTVGSVSLGSSPSTAEWNLRAEVMGNQIRVRYWRSTSSEPTTFNTWTDSSPLAAGETGFGVGYDANSVLRLDYFEAYDAIKDVAVGGLAAGYGGIRKRINRVLAGSSTGSGSFSARRVVVALFSGAATGLGTLLRKGQIQASSSSLGSGSVRIGGLRKNLSGTTSSGARIVLRPIKKLGGSSTSSGETGRQFIGRISGRAGRAFLALRRSGEALIRIRRS